MAREIEPAAKVSPVLLAAHVAGSAIRTVQPRRDRRKCAPIVNHESRAGSPQALALILPATLAVMATAALAPALPLLQRSFAGTPGATWMVPMVLVLPSLCLILVSPLAGWLGDRYGRRRLLIGGLFAYSISGLAPFVLARLPAILASRVLVGIAEAFALTLSTTLIGDLFSGPARDKWLGTQTAVAAISAIVYIAVGGALGGLGWRGPFAIYIMPMIFGILVIAFTWEPGSSVSRAGAVRVRFPYAALRPVWPVTLLAALLFYTAQIQSSVALDALGLKNTGEIASILALATLATVAGSALFRTVIAWPTARLLTISFALIGIGFIGIYSAHAVIVMAIWLAVAQLGCGLLLPTSMTWAIRLLSLEVRARGVGAWQGVFSFGQFLSPLLAIGIAARAGGILPTFGVMGAVAICAAGAGAVIGFRNR